MSDKNINQEFRLENVEEMRNCLIKEINQKELMSKKHKKVCIVLNCMEHLLIVICTIIGCALISTFPSLVGITIEITSYAIRLNICVITAGIKNISQKLRKRKRSMIK